MSRLAVRALRPIPDYKREFYGEDAPCFEGVDHPARSRVDRSRGHGAAGSAAAAGAEHAASTRCFDAGRILDGDGGPARRRQSERRYALPVDSSEGTTEEGS